MLLLVLGLLVNDSGLVAGAVLTLGTTRSCSSWWQRSSPDTATPGHESEVDGWPVAR